MGTAEYGCLDHMWIRNGWKIRTAKIPTAKNHTAKTPSACPTTWPDYDSGENHTTQLLFRCSAHLTDICVEVWWLRLDLVAHFISTLPCFHYLPTLPFTTCLLFLSLPAYSSFHYLPTLPSIPEPHLRQPQVASRQRRRRAHKSDAGQESLNIIPLFSWQSFFVSVKLLATFGATKLFP